MTVVNPRSDQSSAGGFDDLYGLLCVQRGLKSKSSWNKAEVLAAVVEPELFHGLSKTTQSVSTISTQFSIAIFGSKLNTSFLFIRWFKPRLFKYFSHISGSF